MILVDTSIWSLALRRRQGVLSALEQSHVAEWRRLVQMGQVAMMGCVRQELLSGVRDEAVWRRLREALAPFADLPLDSSDYERAAWFFNQCRKQGVSGSAVDLLICSVGARDKLPIYTVDGDFERYARVLGLTLHQPAPQSAE